MGVYGGEWVGAWFLDEWERTGKRLDMGKSCVRFRTEDDIPFGSDRAGDHASLGGGVVGDFRGVEKAPSTGGADVIVGGVARESGGRRSRREETQWDRAQVRLCN